jgi:hypothetical protein
MRFEERVAVLCAQALAAKDDVEVRNLLAELRLALHQHVEELRTGFLAAYTKARSRALQSAPLPELVHDDAAPTTSKLPEEPGLRTWRLVVHEIASEKDLSKALQLCQELTSLLQQHVLPQEGGEA